MSEMRNPFGKKGGLKHQQKVGEVADELIGENLSPVLELLIPTPNGRKKKRFAEVAGFDKAQNLTKIVQVGKLNKSNKPVKREVEAIEDIEKETGIDVTFISYE